MIRTPNDGPTDRQIYANVEITATIGTNMPVTKRDRVWRTALTLREAVEDEEMRKERGLTDRYGIPGFTVQDVETELSEPVADRTIRDCLNAMVELGELTKRETNPSEYRAVR